MQQKRVAQLSFNYKYLIPRLHNPCISSDSLTLPQIRLTGVKLGQEIHRKHDFSSLHCVYNGMFKVIVLLLKCLHILHWENIWGPQGDHVFLESKYTTEMMQSLHWRRLDQRRIDNKLSCV